MKTWKLVYVPPAGPNGLRESVIGSWTGDDAEVRLRESLPMFDLVFDGQGMEVRFYHKKERIGLTNGE